MARCSWATASFIGARCFAVESDRIDSSVAWQCELLEPPHVRSGVGMSDSPRSDTGARGAAGVRDGRAGASLR